MLSPSASRTGSRLPPVLIKGMKGLGDNIFQRPFIRALAAREEVVYLETPWPELYADLPNVLPVKTQTPLRTQAKNERAAAVTWHRPPGFNCSRSISYGTRELAVGSISQAMERCVPLDGAPYVFDLPEDLGPVPPIDTRGRPLAIIRPVTERKEWLNRARNPDPRYISDAAARLSATHFVLVVADLADGEEWLVGDLPFCDLALVRGELSTMALLALLRTADVVVGGVGWIVPASIALGVPAWIVLGGNGGHNAPEVITDPRQDLSVLGFAVPDPYCRCADKSHHCAKTIPDHMAAFETFAELQGIDL